MAVEADARRISEDPVLNFLADEFARQRLFFSGRQLRARLAGDLATKNEHLEWLIAQQLLRPLGGEDAYCLTLRGLLLSRRGAVERQFVGEVLDVLRAEERKRKGYSEIGWSEVARHSAYLKALLRDNRAPERVIYDILFLLRVVDREFPGNPGPWPLVSESLEIVLDAQDLGALLEDPSPEASSTIEEKQNAVDHVIRTGPLSQLHPRVHDAVLPLWRPDTLSNAVDEASRLIARRLQEISRQHDDGGVGMVHALLSEKPPDTKGARLHLSAMATRVQKDSQEGLRYIAAGLQLAIRNVAVHGELRVNSPAEALEILSMISWVLRRLDEVTLVPNSTSDA